MSVSRYRLTNVGKLGAALFVLPTPIAAWKYQAALRAFVDRGEYERALESVSGTIAAPDVSPMFFTALATASLIGLVMILVGREIVTEG